MKRGELKGVFGNPKGSGEALPDGETRTRADGQVKNTPIGWCADPLLYQTVFPRIQWEKLVHNENAGDAIRQELQNPQSRLSIVPVRYRDIPALVREGWIRPLDGCFPEDYLAGFVPQSLALSRMHGNLYAIPEDITPFVYFVRRDILTRVGVPAPKTWGEAESFAVQAARLGYPAFELPGLFPFRTGGLLSLLASNGVDWKNGIASLAENPERLLECYEWLQKLLYSYKLLSPDVFISGLESTLDGNERLRAASGFAWISDFIGLTEEEISRLAFLPFPRGPSADPAMGCHVLLRGRAWCMPCGSIDPGEGLHVLRNLHAPRVRHALHAEGYPFLAWKEVWDDPLVRHQYPLYASAGGLINDELILFNHGDPSLERRLSATLRGALSDRLHGWEWIKRLISPSVSGGGRTSFTAILQKVEGSLGNVNGITQIASELGITVRSLRRMFQGAMKEDIGGYIRKRRMNVAHDLLLTTRIPVKEVAARVGYKNVSAFCRAFRKFWGHTSHEDRLALSSAGTPKAKSRGR